MRRRAAPRQPSNAVRAMPRDAPLRSAWLNQYPYGETMNLIVMAIA